LIKVENQNILTNVSEFNLSEQVRASILLLEKSWQEKNINLQIAFDEYDIKANEEMLCFFLRRRKYSTDAARTSNPTAGAIAGGGAKSIAETTAKPTAMPVNVLLSVGFILPLNCVRYRCAGLSL
jgi:hypothetical protein